MLRANRRKQCRNPGTDGVIFSRFRGQPSKQVIAAGRRRGLSQRHQPLYEDFPILAWALSSVQVVRPSASCRA